MKDFFTVKEIMKGTGLSRQRIHTLIKSRNISVNQDKNKFIIKWNDVLLMADNASILNFLKDILENEKKEIDKAYENLKENEEVVKFAKAIEYAKILLEGDPGIDSSNSEGWKKWIEAGVFFSDLMAVHNPAEESESEQAIEVARDTNEEKTQ